MLLPHLLLPAALLAAVPAPTLPDPLLGTPQDPAADAAGAPERVHLGTPYRSHGEGTVGVDLSADGLRALSIGDDEVLRIHDTRSGEVLHEFPDQGDPAARFALDGTVVVMRDPREGLRVLDVESGDVRRVEGIGEALGAVRVSTDGKRLALADAQGNLVVVDLGTLEHEVVFGGLGRSASLTWSADDTLIASCAGGGVQVVRLGDSEHLWSASLQSPLYSASFTPDGRHLVCGSDGRLILWPAVEGGPPEIIEGPDGNLGRPALSPDGRLAYVGDADGRLVAVDLSDGETAFAVPATEEPISDVVLSRDGELLIAGARDGSVRFFDKRGREVLCGDGHRRGVTRLAWSPDGAGLCSVGRDGLWVRWDPAGTGPATAVEAHAAIATGLALDAEGRTWTCGEDGLLRGFGADGGPVARVELEEDLAATALLPLPDGRVLVGTEDGVLLVHTPPPAEGEAEAPELQELEVACEDAVLALVPSPDGLMVAVASADGCLRVLDARTFETVLEDEDATWDPWYDALWLDGERLLVLGLEGELVLRRVTDGEVLAEAEVDSEEQGAALAGGRDGAPIAVASEDGLWLLDPADLSVTRTVDLGGAVPTDLALDPSGTRLACGLADGTILVLPLAK